MDSISYKLLKTPESQRSSDIEFLRTLKPTIILETVDQLLQIISKIRQNVSEDLVVQTGILRIIDWFSNQKD